MASVWPYERRPESINPWNIRRPLTHEERYEDRLARWRWDHRYYESSIETRRRLDETFPKTFAASEQNRTHFNIEEPDYSDEGAWLAWVEQCEGEVETGYTENFQRRLPHSPPPSPPPANISLPTPDDTQITHQQQAQSTSSSQEEEQQNGRYDNDTIMDSGCEFMTRYLHTQHNRPEPDAILAGDVGEEAWRSLLCHYNAEDPDVWMTPGEAENKYGVSDPRVGEASRRYAALQERVFAEAKAEIARRDMMHTAAKFSSMPATPPKSPTPTRKIRALTRSPTRPVTRSLRSLSCELVELGKDGHTVVNQTGPIFSRRTRSAAGRRSSTGTLNKVSGSSRISKPKTRNARPAAIPRK